MRIPYVGITDFTNFSQVERMLGVVKENSKKTKIRRRLHVGVMMSYKTLHDLETKWAVAFPPKESIVHIFSSDETMNCLHYADYTATDVEKSLVAAIHFGGLGMNALQLDMVWPNPEHVARAARVSHKPLEIVLQIGKNAFEQAHDSPEGVVERLQEYLSIIHYVLLDRSMGQGIGMDACGLIPFARAIREAFPDLGIVAAGGLGPESVRLLEPLLVEFPDISIDAQSRLRPSGNALDPIDWDMAETYIVKAFELLK